MKPIDSPADVPVNQGVLDPKPPIIWPRRTISNFKGYFSAVASIWGWPARRLIVVAGPSGAPGPQGLYGAPGVQGKRPDLFSAV